MKDGETFVFMIYTSISCLNSPELGLKTASHPPTAAYLTQLSWGSLPCSRVPHMTRCFTWHYMEILYHTCSEQIGESGPDLHKMFPPRSQSRNR